MLSIKRILIMETKMQRRIINIILTLEERKRLETIINSSKSSQNDKKKANVLLLTDVGEHGPKISPEGAAEKVKLSRRSVGRIRSAYANNSSIEEVFSFVNFSQQSSLKSNNEAVDPLIPPAIKERNCTYIEMDDSGSNPFLIESIKCRVTLTKEERERLESIIKEGKQTARKFNRAKILLLADEGAGVSPMTDMEISKKLNVSLRTVARVRRLLVTKGQIDDVLNFNHHNAGAPPKIDGKIQAAIVALTCSTPPEGRCKWTLRLLADQLVKLEIIDSISHTTVGEILKKTNLSLGSTRNG